MRRWPLGTAALLVLCLEGWGCAYPADRFADLADVLTLELTAGPGVDIHGQATAFCGTAIGSSKQWGMMMHGRRLGLGSRDTAGILVRTSTDVARDLMWLAQTYAAYQAGAGYTAAYSGLPKAVPALTASTRISEQWMGSVRGSKSPGPSVRSWLIIFRWPPWVPLVDRAEWPRLLDVELGASLLLGAHVGLSPIEFLDLALGIITVDILGDDARRG